MISESYSTAELPYPTGTRCPRPLPSLPWQISAQTWSPPTRMLIKFEALELTKTCDFHWFDLKLPSGAQTTLALGQGPEPISTSNQLGWNRILLGSHWAHASLQSHLANRLCIAPTCKAPRHLAVIWPWFGATRATPTLLGWLWHNRKIQESSLCSFLHPIFWLDLNPLVLSPRRALQRVQLWTLCTVVMCTCKIKLKWTALESLESSANLRFSDAIGHLFVLSRPHLAKLQSWLKKVELPVCEHAQFAMLQNSI